MNDKNTIEQAARQPDTDDRQEARKPSQLQEVIREQAREEDALPSASDTLRKILGGDYLTTDAIRRQVGVIIIIAVFTLVYISNRYSCQQDLIEIDRLNKELKDAKYKALASSSELTEMCRESNVLNMLKNNKDSVLHIPNQPPYIITVPENE